MGIINQTHKNAIINGDFNIWQRGTSFSTMTTQNLSTDRWLYHKAGTMIHTITRETDVPTVAQSGHKSNYSMKVDCTAAQGSIGAAEYNHISQYIEGYNFVPFVGKTATLSFWVKATKTGIYCIGFRNPAIDRSYIAEYEVNSSDTWEKKEVTLTFDYSGGTWNYTNGTGLDVTWTLASGTNFHGVKDTWLTGNYIATSNQVNACDNIANNFQLSQVQFELGETASPFESKTIQQEMELCQRYYEKSYSVGVNSGTIDPAGSLYSIAASTLLYRTCIQPIYKVVKRTIPTIAIYSPGTGAISNIRDISSGGNIDRTADITSSNTKSCRIRNTEIVTDEHLHSAHFTADAEL